MILDYFGFVLSRSVIGQENSHHPPIQSNVKLKQIPTWSVVFSRPSGRLLVFTSNSHWKMRMLTVSLIGSHYYLVFRYSLKTALWSEELTRESLLGFKVGDGSFSHSCPVPLAHCACLYNTTECSWEASARLISSIFKLSPKLPVLFIAPHSWYGLIRFIIIIIFFSLMFSLWDFIGW